MSVLLVVTNLVQALLCDNGFKFFIILPTILRQVQVMMPCQKTCSVYSDTYLTEADNVHNTSPKLTKLSAVATRSVTMQSY